MIFHRAIGRILKRHGGFGVIRSGAYAYTTKSCNPEICDTQCKNTPIIYDFSQSHRQDS